MQSYFLTVPYEKEKKPASKTDCNNYCNRELKKECGWLKDVDKFALTNAVYNMDAAYQKFFREHAGYPKFKSKHDNHKPYTTNFTNGKLAKEMLVFGLPIALQMIVIAISGMVAQSAINLQGSIFVAGYTAMNKMYGLWRSGVTGQFPMSVTIPSFTLSRYSS